jgi:hypothetical protein
VIDNIRAQTPADIATYTEIFTDLKETASFGDDARLPAVIGRIVGSTNHRGKCMGRSPVTL